MGELTKVGSTMKRILFLSLLIFSLGFSFNFLGGADQPDFPNIYIDEGCAGTHVGSQANPYDDLSDINWTTGGDNSIYDYLAGTPSASPTIYLAKGDTWREQITVGCSGTATYPIVITSYGSGANPIINGADLVSTWTEYALWSTDWDDSLGNAANGSDDRNHRTVYSCSTTGTKVRVTLKAGNAEAGIDGTSIGLRDGTSDDFDGTPTRITWDTGSSTATIASGATKRSDEMTFSVTNGNDYLIHIYWEDTYSYAYASGTGYYQNSAPADDTLTQNVSYSDNTVNYVIDKVEVYAVQANTWQATLTAEPDQVFFNSVQGVKQASAAACTSTNDWYWAANVLYVYSTSDPDIAYFDPGIEATYRDFCIDVNSQDYIVIQHLNLKHGNSANVLLDGTNQTDLNYCISVDGVDGVEMDTTGSKVQNCVIYNCTNGIDVDAAGYVKNTIIRSCADDVEETGANINKTTNNIEDDNDTNPLLTDPANGDFTLQPNSPCIDAGVDVGLTEDYAGNPIGREIEAIVKRIMKRIIVAPIGYPDIGAYEYYD